MRTMAILSDIHGNLPALEEVMADMAERRVDVVANLGDHLSGPLWPRETALLLMQQGWIHISGNHDRQIVADDPAGHGPSDRHASQSLGVKEKEWLRSLPSVARVDNGVLLVHGSASSDSEYLLETIDHGRLRLASPAEILVRLGDTGSRVILCGHTHIQRLVQLGEGVLIVNPGSVGLPAYEDDLPVHHIVESGSPHARYALVEIDGDRCSTRFVSVPYDYRKSADQARLNGRPDWEVALLTGYMTFSR